VCIGERCAVGYRVSIKAVTHDVRRPAPDHEGRVTAIEKPISIGDRCWIGDGVFIREGVRLGDDVIVAANSVVTKSFESGSVIAGVPARKIRGAVIQ
jgi:maltose O-acetyltransferase